MNNHYDRLAKELYLLFESYNSSTPYDLDIRDAIDKLIVYFRLLIETDLGLFS